MVQNKYFRNRIKLLKKVASQTSGKKISRQSETKCDPHHIPPPVVLKHKCTSKSPRGILKIQTQG